MSESIVWSLNVQVVAGPQLSASGTIDVEAYGMIEVEVPGGDAVTPGILTVDVQPSGANQVKFLMISSSVYDANLTYEVDASGSPISLDGLQIFRGNGQVGLLGATQNQFVFNNQAGLASPASIQILVGRDATP